MAKGDRIFYKEGYKYQTTRDGWYFTGILLPADVIRDFYTLTASGWCVIKKGYAWDGATMAPDLKSAMLASAVHDAYCQAAKDRLIDYKEFSPQYHRAFRDQCVEGGMWGWMAALWHSAVIVGRGGDPEITDDNLEQCAP